MVQTLLRPAKVIHPSTNWTRCGVTVLTETNALQLWQTTTKLGTCGLMDFTHHTEALSCITLWLTVSSAVVITCSSI